MPAATAAALEARVLSTGVTGARLLQDPLDELLDLFGFGKMILCLMVTVYLYVLYPLRF